MKAIAVLLMLMVLLAGCNSKEASVNLEWYPTKADAIAQGLQKEGIRKPADSVLAVEEVNGETLVFYENHDALGVASIAEGTEGFAWHRTSAYIGFASDADPTVSPFMHADYHIVTSKGQTLYIVAGEVSDRSIRTMLIRDDGKEREIPVPPCQACFTRCRTRNMAIWNWYLLWNRFSKAYG